MTRPIFKSSSLKVEYDTEAVHKAISKGLKVGDIARLSVRYKKGRRKLVKVRLAYGGLYGGCNDPTCCHQGHYWVRVVPECTKPAA